jgi:heptosyltransferase-3
VTRLPRREHFRDLSHFALATASELLAPALRFGAETIGSRPPSPPSNWLRLLIVGHGHIGDVLCQTVSLDGLARGLPRCEIDYLTTPVAAEVLGGNPALHAILPWNTGPQPHMMTRESRRALRGRDYDAILCTNVVRHHEALRLALALRIPNRVAYDLRGLSGLATIPIHLDGPTTPPVQSRIMFNTLTGRPDDTELRPRIFPTASDRESADAERKRLGVCDDDIVLASSITTRQTIGRVPQAFFVDVLSRIQAIRPDVKIVLCGSSDDSAALQRVANALPDRVLQSAGRLTLRSFSAFLAKSAVFFGMDSGPRHIANAAGIPVVFVRNMAVRAAEAGPYCPTESDVAPPGDFLSADAIARALSSVDVAHVADRILALTSR